ncbi:MAG: 4Fe-4S cluster-binding domain-containing protein [Pyrinomonadaceae bacterium]
MWLYRLFHNSVVDGPGRRSVIQVSGCSIRCVGCHVPQTHRTENGTLTPVHSIVDEIIDKRDEDWGQTYNSQQHENIACLTPDPGPIHNARTQIHNARTRIHR